MLTARLTQYRQNTADEVAGGGGNAICRHQRRCGAFALRENCLDPFGIAVDPTRGQVYVGLRLGNDVVVFNDTPSPGTTGPRLFLSRQDGCQGLPITVFGAGFKAAPSGTVEVRMDGALLATGETTIACVDRAGRIIAIPEALRGG